MDAILGSLFFSILHFVFQNFYLKSVKLREKLQVLLS